MTDERTGGRRREGRGADHSNAASGEILLPSPIASHADVVTAVEDRSYAVFIAGALATAILGGFALAIVASLASSGAFLDERVPWLVQAHGSAQLQGWAGLFVAGMGLRLLPRFAGRRPLTHRVNLPIFAMLFLGTVIRTVTQPLDSGAVPETGLLVAGILWALGSGTFSVVVIRTLLMGRGGREPWRLFAFAGAAWWAAWAAMAMFAAIRGARSDAYVPTAVDEPMTWMVMLGAIGNFIWAVQSRSVPIFFGRKRPTLRSLAIPGILLNLGVVFLFVAALTDRGTVHERLVGAGFVFAGPSLLMLAPLAGACWGSPTRLRPRAQAAARFVLAANIAAVFCAVLLLWAGAYTLIEGSFAAAEARDAARHAFGVGLITLLIVGMAQLVAPFFALRRVGAEAAPLIERSVFWLLASAAVLRIAAGLMLGHTSTASRMHLSALAGTVALLGLVLFALMIVRAVREEPRIKAQLGASAARARERNTATK